MPVRFRALGPCRTDSHEKWSFTRWIIITSWKLQVYKDLSGRTGESHPPCINNTGTASAWIQCTLIAARKIMGRLVGILNP